MDSIKDLKRKFNHQRARSRQRIDKNGNPIKWELTFDEWLDIWTMSGKLHLRGRGLGKYHMSRKNDVGNYAKDNVEIKCQADNVSEGQHGRSFPNRKGHLNPNAKKITLEGKTFNSVKEAAEYYNISRAGLRYRLKESKIYGQLVR